MLTLIKGKFLKKGIVNTKKYFLMSDIFAPGTVYIINKKWSEKDIEAESYFTVCISVDTLYFTS